jgi:hypothetical protein
MKRREVSIVQATRPFAYRSPFPNEEHTLLICVFDDSISDQEREELARQIVEAKCRYTVC